MYQTKSSVIKRAEKLLSPAAVKYYPARDIYVVEMGVNENRMHEHPSMDSYCEKCIDEAIEEKRRKFFSDRLIEMGKVFEYQEKGFYRETRYKWGKEGKSKGLYIKKVKHKASKEKVVMQMRRNLRKSYPATTGFSYFYYSCGEHDGFKLCDGCGIIFEQGLIISDQELEHWESLTPKQLKRCIKNPHEAYQLDKILYEHHAQSKYAERIENLANRILA